METFVFESVSPRLAGPGDLVLQVDVGLHSKEQLFAWYAHHLELPGYFGANWDALEECLRDLSWVKQSKVVISHREVPLTSNPGEQRVYLAVLASAVRSWSADPAHQLIAAFDFNCKEEVEALAEKPA